ncbi:MAG: hypothetical protein NTV43_04830 [Methylococcales bacterium]|nr:hypothetical protein [Methylococcales bacterium]
MATNKKALSHICGFYRSPSKQKMIYGRAALKPLPVEDCMTFM